MKKVITLFFFASLLLVACKSTKNVSSSNNTAISESSTIENWIIANEKVKCSEASLNLCFKVKVDGNTDYALIDAEIEGFTYEAGYKYQLEVKVTSNSKTGTKYSLVNELYKIPMK